MIITGATPGVEGTEGVATEGAEVASDNVDQEQEGKKPDEPETTAAWYSSFLYSNWRDGGKVQREEQLYES